VSGRGGASRGVGVVGEVKRVANKDENEMVPGGEDVFTVAPAPRKVRGGTRRDSPAGDRQTGTGGIMAEGGWK